MCEPTTILAGISLATTVVGGVMSAQAQRQQAAQEASQSYYAAGIARNNQIAANHAANDAIERGKVDRARAAIAAKQTVGAQRAALAAGGVEVNSGSALDLQVETTRLGEYDQLVAMNNAQREALGFRTQGANFGGEVGLHTSAAQNSLTSGQTKATASLIGTAGSVADKWYTNRTAGIKGF